MQILSVLLEKAAQQGGGIATFLPLILIVVIFYFFMMRPQMKKAKETRKFHQNIEKGQRVITIGGIHGRVEEIKDSTVIISVEGGMRLKMEKRALTPDSSQLLSEAETK
ncbi:MAG: preprotein translocase subunit YajC [Flavobacteriales bacterium]